MLACEFAYGTSRVAEQCADNRLPSKCESIKQSTSGTLRYVASDRYVQDPRYLVRT